MYNKLKKFQNVPFLECHIDVLTSIQFPILATHLHPILCQSVVAIEESRRVFCKFVSFVWSALRTSALNDWRRFSRAIDLA